MAREQCGLSTGRWLAGTAGLAAGAYAAYVGLTWYRYGDVPRGDEQEQDDLLDRFMPSYEVVERNHLRVAAPAEITLAAAAEMDLQALPLVRAIFKARELIMGAPAERPPRRLTLAELKSIGWGVLADSPGREIVLGAVTKPWEANPTFRPLPPDEFAPFREPGYVKIVWTLRADPAGSAESVFRTETRATTTDAEARRRFRWYWAFLSPGILLIRRALLAPVKKEAERRARGAARPAPAPVAGAA
jgi:hypothetical protein